MNQPCVPKCPEMFGSDEFKKAAGLSNYGENFGIIYFYLYSIY